VARPDGQPPHRRDPREDEEDADEAEEAVDEDDDERGAAGVAVCRASSADSCSGTGTVGAAGTWDAVRQCVRNGDMERAFRRTERVRTRPRSSASTSSRTASPRCASASAEAASWGKSRSTAGSGWGWSSAAARWTGRIWPLWTGRQAFLTGLQCHPHLGLQGVDGRAVGGADYLDGEGGVGGGHVDEDACWGQAREGGGADVGGQANHEKDDIGSSGGRARGGEGEASVVERMRVEGDSNCSLRAVRSRM